MLLINNKLIHDMHDYQYMENMLCERKMSGNLKGCRTYYLKSGLLTS